MDLRCTCVLGGRLLSHACVARAVGVAVYARLRRSVLLIGEVGDCTSSLLSIEELWTGPLVLVVSVG